MNTVNNRIVKAFEEKVQAANALFESFPWENKEAYAWALGQTYYFVRHTTSFIALGVAGFSQSHRSISDKLQKHLSEERGHDLMLLHDLKALGTSIDSIDELPQTSALYQTQYYYFSQRQPAAHFGYAFYLEGLAARYCREVALRIRNSHGAKAATFYRVHGEEDVDHFEKGLQLLADLSPDEQDLVLKNLNQTHLYYTSMLSEIASKFGKATIGRAA